MGFEAEVLRRARLRHAQSVDAYRQAQDRRREQVYTVCPRVREIDLTLRSTMAEVVAVTFRNGQDPREAVAAIKEKNMSLQLERTRLLRQNGFDPEELREGPKCRTCSDTGYIGEKMCSCLQVICQEEQKKELTQLLRGKRSSFDDFSLDYYSDAVDPTTGLVPRTQMEGVYEYCVNYAWKFTPKSENLLMIGSTGLGKTLLSACIARQVVSAGYSVVYDTAIHLFSCLEKQKFGGATPEELRTVERMEHCDLLIMDDLGTEMPTSFIAPALYSIVNGRLLSGLPTIISTNLTLSQLDARYSPQISSRLQGEYVKLIFLGQDIRQIQH